MVEQEAVNFEVAGSSPAPGAILDESPFFYVKIQTSNALAINFILACYNKSVRSYHLLSPRLLRR